MYLICGEALFDVFATQSGDLTRPDMAARAGGSPFNVAIGLARQDRRAAFLSQLSNDALGQSLVDILAGEGVDTGYIQRTDHSTTISLVGQTPAGTPSYAFYSMGADTSLRTQDLPDLGADVQGIHFGSYALVAGETANALQALAHRESTRFISLDPNIRPTIEPDPGVWINRIDALLPVTNLVKVSDEDIGLLYGDAEPAAIASQWLAKGAELVVVTAGGEAATAYSATTKVAVTPPSVDVVDTVGAGDTFQCTLLSLLADRLGEGDVLTSLSERQLADILTYAATAAAITCTRSGADLPGTADIKAALV